MYDVGNNIYLELNKFSFTKTITKNKHHSASQMRFCLTG